jgi:diguanylate cyclase (GGDEF)-like protein
MREQAAGGPEGGGLARAAKIAGLNSFATPTLEAVERRRWQIWLITLLLLAAIAAGLSLATLLRDTAPPAWMTVGPLRWGLLGLVVLFCVYAVEKEIQLSRLSRLLVDERVLTAALTNRLREISALLEAGKAMNLDLDLSEVLHTILTSALELLTGRDASIMLLQGDGELRTVAASDSSFAVGARVRLGESIAGRVAETREPLMVQGALSDRSTARSRRPDTPEESAMSVPLVHREIVVGVLNINARAGRVYTGHDLRALGIFGEQAAAAIAHARLYEAQRLTASQSSYHALHDSLTALPNRSLLLDRVRHGLARRRAAGERVALVFLDLDNFKGINDSLGHAAGDKALVAFGERVRQTIRAGDTLARFGGDEFAVLMEDVASDEEARYAAERMVAALVRPLQLGDREVTIAVSAGLVLETPGKSDADSLLRNADLALHAAKGRGKGVVTVFEDSMRVDTPAASRLEAELRQALEAGELELHYQPIVNLKSREMVGVEALVRWRHHERGLLPAGAFVPFAEQTGVLPAIDMWTLARACSVAHTLIAPGRPPLTVHVNLLASRLHEIDIVERVDEALRSNGLEASRLVLEISERGVLPNLAAARERLAALRARGVRLALDDFGVGHSSLEYLRELPIDTVKIDRIFVEGVGREGSESQVVRAAVRLGASLGLDVIAVGVERAEQVEALNAIGCGLAQGYFFGKPQPLDTLRRGLASSTV